MIAPAALPFLALLVTVVMALTSPVWAVSLVATVWIVLLRRALTAWLVGLALLVAGLVLGGLHALTRAWLGPETAVLTFWLTPFTALPVLNALSRLRRGGPEPIADKDKPLRLTSLVFDMERARLRAAYEPPPLADEP